MIFGLVLLLIFSSIKFIFQVFDFDVIVFDLEYFVVEEDFEGFVFGFVFIICFLVIIKFVVLGVLMVDFEICDEGFEIINVVVYDKVLVDVKGVEGDWERRFRYMGFCKLCFFLVYYERFIY